MLTRAASFMPKVSPRLERVYQPNRRYRAPSRKQAGRISHVVCNRAATLVYLANQAVITVHAWLARADRPDRPDQLLFDLDPAGEEFGQARWAALRLRDLLDELSLPSLVKTTGASGLHVLVPLARRQGFDPVRGFAREVAEVLAAREPARLTTELPKAKRGGRLFLDTTRNAYAQTAVAPYTVRARPGAPVVTPLDSSEVEDARLRPDRFGLRAVRKRLRDDDPWARGPAPVRSLAGPRQRLDALRADRRR